MYYEERVIDGVLHWRTTPGSEWKLKSAEQLTAALMELRRLNAPRLTPVGAGDSLLDAFRAANAQAAEPVATLTIHPDHTFTLRGPVLDGTHEFIVRPHRETPNV